ncbi:GNAT family N-acetyltransferase [Hathewaya histolytica]|uniref:Acetyltransferase n=1 Tax=Hathewaya histolytica TaxID=1498 RepID=A0A4U9RSL7_HATHI|nr:GNAT family N-acetyltransferase [Hathewaya histolytica]VTQ91980.1 Uncharacterised protein [Hathewaya histolytica]
MEVITEYKNRGIGKTLVKKAIEETSDFYMIDLSCDDNLTSFYDKFNMFKTNAMIVRNYDKQTGE